MGYNYERTRPVSRGPDVTNNGYWCRDNKADGRILTMSRRVNREGLTRRTVLLLQWGTERARCPVQHWLLNQAQQGRWPNELTIATRLSHHSKCQDAFRVGYRECRKSHANYQLVSQVGFLQHAWESAARQHLICGSYQSACSTGDETRAHSSGEATWAFATEKEQPPAESPTREEKRTAASRPYGTPQVDLRHMLD